MLVRDFQDADESAVVALWSEVLPDSAPHNDPLMAIRKKLAVDRDLFFVAIVDGLVAGTAMGGYDGHRGWIYSVAVALSQRRRGIGRALILRLEEEFSARLPEGQLAGASIQRGRRRLLQEARLSSRGANQHG